MRAASFSPVSGETVLGFGVMIDSTFTVSKRKSWYFFSVSTTEEAVALRRSRSVIIPTSFPPSISLNDSYTGLKRSFSFFITDGIVVYSISSWGKRCGSKGPWPVSYTHLRAHETRHDL